MLNVKELLINAKAEILNAYENEAVDIRLEEFDRSSQQIVVSYLLPDKNPMNGIGILMGSKRYERVFKTIYFSGDGVVESVRIYSPK